MAVFVFAPAALPPFKLQMLGIFSGLLTGLFGFFLTGEISTKINVDIGKGKMLVIQATGGLGLAVATVAWWSSELAPVQSSTRVASELGAVLKSVDGGSVQQSGQNDHKLEVQPSSRVRELAQTLSQSDPQYRKIGVLGTDRSVPLTVFSDAVSELNVTHGGVDRAKLEAAFGDGIDGFKLEMSPSEVNDQLPEKFATTEWASLPRAGEFKSADVRYFWVLLSKFDSSSRFANELTAFRQCWSGQSYVTFLFVEQRLLRISVRLYPDCSSQRVILAEFARSFSIANVNLAGPLVFQIQLTHSVVAAYTGNGVSSLEVFSPGSPTAQ